MLSAQTAPRDFGFGEDENFLRDVGRKMLDDRLPLDRLRQLVASEPEPIYDAGLRAPWDETLWSEIIELGWAGLAIGEEDGGSEFKMVGIAALLEEVGRHALPSPLISTLWASLVLRAAGGDVARQYLQRIAGEGVSASLAMTDDRGSWEPEDTSLVVREANGTLTLDGTARFVQDAFKADFLVVSARHGNEVVLVAVDVDADGLTLSADHIHDLTRDQASAVFEGVRVEVSSLVCRDAASVLRDVWPSLLVLVTADLCGASEWLLQTTTEYATQRVVRRVPLASRSSMFASDVLTCPNKTWKQHSTA